MIIRQTWARAFNIEGKLSYQCLSKKQFPDLRTLSMPTINAINARGYREWYVSSSPGYICPDWLREVTKVTWVDADRYRCIDGEFQEVVNRECSGGSEQHATRHRYDPF